MMGKRIQLENDVRKLVEDSKMQPQAVVQSLMRVVQEQQTLQREFRKVLWQREKRGEGSPEFQKWLLWRNWYQAWGGPFPFEEWLQLGQETVAAE